jgi:NAD(P)-dependent dehydrogenase (short-subunit alcohol dehydrogenase family)
MPAFFSKHTDFVVPQAASVFVVDPELVAATHACNALAPLRLIQVLVPLDCAKALAGGSSTSRPAWGNWPRMGGFWPGYRMSKAALNALTRLTAKELEGTPIKINSVCPGWCRTGMGGPRTLPAAAEEGAKGIVWAALLPDDGPSGGFFRDGQVIEW